MGQVALGSVGREELQTERRGDVENKIWFKLIQSADTDNSRLVLLLLVAIKT
jgi:hypothetical protein